MSCPSWLSMGARFVVALPLLVALTAAELWLRGLLMLGRAVRRW